MRKKKMVIMFNISVVQKMKKCKVIITIYTNENKNGKLHKFNKMHKETKK